MTRTAGWGRWAMVPALAAVAHAGYAIDLYQGEDRTLGFVVDAAGGFFNTTEDYLGEGGKTWGETYLRGVLVGMANFWQGDLYGGLGAIAQGTWGDGDAAGYTNGRERDISLEDGYLGWRSTNKLFDFSFGRQQFTLGDGLIIANDMINLGKGLDAIGDVDRGGVYYIAARKSFSNTAIFRVDPDGPLRGDFFWLQSNNPYQQNTELAGFNLEYVSERLGTLGASWLKVTDVDKGAGLGIFDQRDGMRIFNVRAQGSLGVENLFLSFEYVKERGGSTPIKNDGSAWTVEGAWTFATLPWTPTINYRHARFSADKVASADVNEGFDPLFFGLSRGLGTWYQGEIISNYAGPANSGDELDRIELTLVPRENLPIMLQYWDVRAVGDAPRLASREVDLFTFWGFNDHLTVVPLLGIDFPRGRDLKAAQGNDDPNVYTQLVLLINY